MSPTNSKGGLFWTPPGGKQKVVLINEAGMYKQVRVEFRGHVHLPLILSIS